MEQIDDGGPAHPFTIHHFNPDARRDEDVSRVESFPGLSIRDWFAGQVLMGMQQSGLFESIRKRVGNNSENREKDAIVAMSMISQICYRQADSMIAARRIPATQPEGK